MMITQEINSIQITNVEIIKEKDDYYVFVDYSDGDYDEFGPYKSYDEAKSVVY